MSNRLEKIITVARGLEAADLVIKNANLINVLSEEIYLCDIAITDGVVVGIGAGYHGKEEIDVNGAYVSPALIDGHVHIESSMMLPFEFAKAVVPCGTTTVVIDPHEISNVLGLHGISFMHEAVNNLPLNVYTMLPSCVPATPYETTGFDLNSYDLALLMDSKWVLGLAEMMNYSGLLNLDKTVLAKLDLAKSKGKKIDGHAPMLTGKDLCAYIASGVKSDHECTVAEEAIEKIRLGMYVMIREGTAAKDLDALIPVLKNNNTRKCIFVTDDRHPKDLRVHINDMIRRAIAGGVDIIKAVQVGSLNTAEYFGLENQGAIAPGYKADMLIIPDINTFMPNIVIKDGKIVAKDGKLISCPEDYQSPAVRSSVNVHWIELEDFEIKSDTNKVNTIEIIPHKLVTNFIVSEAKLENGYLQSNTDTDTLKIVVIERHRATGNIGKGFVKGFNLKSGAIASTVAHDSHNMIVVGTNDYDMYVAAVQLVKMQGGKVVVNNGEVISKLPLPIAGLMTDKDFDYVVSHCEELNSAVQGLGCTLDDAFMTMGFLALPVIPELKITDKGLFSTKAWDFVGISPDMPFE
ncbi:MAG: adenine deaminase [bacterium]|nr:adenine deaminase [bacterium]